MKAKNINVGFLLEDNAKDRAKMMKTLSHDESLQYVFEPDSVEQMYDMIIHLGKKGYSINKLVLMGHGGKSTKHIGRLWPADIDVEAAKKMLKKTQKNVSDLEKEKTSLENRIKRAKKEETIKKLKKELADTKDNLKNFSEILEDDQVKVDRFNAVSEVMAKDAIVGLINCYAADGQEGLNMMRKLGRVFLSKNGGKVIGNDGLLWQIHSKPLISWIAGKDDVLMAATGDWKSYSVRSNTCGAECNDFDTYGYCDNPQSKDGGYCWRHR